MSIHLPMKFILSFLLAVEAAAYSVAQTVHELPFKLAYEHIAQRKLHSVLLHTNIWIKVTKLNMSIVSACLSLMQTV